MKTFEENLVNVLIISFAFFMVFTGYNSFQGILTTLYSPAVGFLAWFFVYISLSLGNFIAPYVMNLFPDPKWAIFATFQAFSGFVMMNAVLSSSLLNDVDLWIKGLLIVPFAIILGISSSILWTAHAVIMAQLSNKDESNIEEIESNIEELQQMQVTNEEKPEKKPELKVITSKENEKNEIIEVKDIIFENPKEIEKKPENTENSEKTEKVAEKPEKSEENSEKNREIISEVVAIQTSQKIEEKLQQLEELRDNEEKMDEKAALISKNSQEIDFSKIKNTTKMGLYSGIFFGVFQLNMLFGNSIMLIFSYLRIPQTLSFIFLFLLTVVGSFSIFFLKLNKNSTKNSENISNLSKIIKKTIHYMFYDKRMLCLHPFLLYSGFSKSFFLAILPLVFKDANPELNSKNNEFYKILFQGFICFGVFQFISSILFGRLLDNSMNSNPQKENSNEQAKNEIGEENAELVENLSESPKNQKRLFSIHLHPIYVLLAIIILNFFTVLVSYLMSFKVSVVFVVFIFCSAGFAEGGVITAILPLLNKCFGQNSKWNEKIAQETLEKIEQETEDDEEKIKNNEKWKITGFNKEDFTIATSTSKLVQSVATAVIGGMMQLFGFDFLVAFLCINLVLSAVTLFPIFSEV